MEVNNLTKLPFFIMFRLRKNRLPFLLSSILIVLSLVYIFGDFSNFNWVFPYFVYPSYSKILLCYENDTSNRLSEISSNSIRLNKSIFFIESTCHYKGVDLNARQACSVESAALQNPNLDVYLLFPSPIESGWETNLYIRQLLSYSNVYLRHINMNEFFKRTPLEEKWLVNRAGLRTSLWPQSHASDILRYTLLWKYGGFYIDLDVILLRPFGKMMNFAGAESLTAVAAGVISVSHGSFIADMCINDIAYKFKGTDWGNNGPGVITRVVKNLCKQNEIEAVLGLKCEGFTILKPPEIYPVRWQDWRLYFTQENSSRVMATLNGSLAVHVWNSFSKTAPAIKGSSQPYVQLASKFCPKVYSAIPEETF